MDSSSCRLCLVHLSLLCPGPFESFVLGPAPEMKKNMTTPNDLLHTIQGKFKSNPNQGGKFSFPTAVCIRCRQNKVKCIPLPNLSSCKNCFAKGLSCVPANSSLKKKHISAGSTPVLSIPNKSPDVGHSQDFTPQVKQAVLAEPVGGSNLEPNPESSKSAWLQLEECRATTLHKRIGSSEQEGTEKIDGVDMNFCTRDLGPSDDISHLEIWLRRCIPKARKQCISALFSELVNEEVMTARV
jgi:hypothetical protein